ncbi:MAG: hypothetical protein ACREBD_25905, partial [Blastocatellia bacterium]
MKQINTRQFKVVLVIVAALACAVSVAWAQNIRFSKATATLVDTDVVVSWKEAGLAGNQNISYAASAWAKAIYVCVRYDGTCAGGCDFWNVEAPVTAVGTFASGKNGSITASLILEPPVTEECLCNGTLTLSEVSYSNIQITDTTNNITKTATPSAISATPYVCPNN